MESTSASMSDAGEDAEHVDALQDGTGKEQQGKGEPSRLIITKMVLENFKSYAGVNEVGPFHKNFSAVVGPNGSGKSNVIDAMLFVFGKRAKKLRLNKVSELIHSSEAYADNPPDYARVSVHFHDIVDTGDGDDDYEVIPNSQVVVTRIATKDNSSSYRLNDRNCSFRDVATFLNKKGVDLDNNRFLILQGEVELISMMPPKGKTENDEGLLEYLEDIIGSNKYLEDINEAATKVETLSDQRQEKLNRVKAVEKDMESLEGAKVEAEALLTKEREIRRKKNILYQLNAHEANLEVSEWNEKRAFQEEKLSTERQHLQQADDRVAEIEGGLSAQTREYDKIFMELDRTKREFAAYERQDIQLREEIKHTKANSTKLESKIDAEKKKALQSTHKAENAENKLIPELEATVQELEERKAEEDSQLEAIMNQVQGTTHKLRADLEEKMRELAPVKQQRAVFQSALDTAASKVRLLEEKPEKARKDLEEAEKKLASIDTDEANKKDELARSEEELTTSKKRIEAAKEEEKKKEKKEGALSQRCAELMKLAEDEKNEGNSSVGLPRAVMGILKAIRKGGELSKVGVIGRLGDLATIPDKYDVAISTACGHLDHIVVHTTEGAQKCVDYLRRRKLGRANFIPLDKLKKGAHDRAVETPEGAPRLFDLIVPADFAITPALYLGVGNTLVAPDLETATRWAYDFGKRWRVVTIDGNLIEMSGTMQGGGKTVRKGGMKLANSRGNKPTAAGASLESPEDRIAKLEAEAKEASDALNECRADRQTLKEEIRKLEGEVKKLTVRIKKLKMDVAGFSTTRVELAEVVPSLRERCNVSSEDQKRLRDMRRDVAKCEEDMSSCVTQASELESDVAEIQKAIMDAGGEQRKQQEKACKEIAGELTDAKKKLNSAKVTASSSRKAAANARKAKESAEEELQSNIELAETKANQLQKLEQGAKKVTDAYEKVKGLEAEMRKELEVISKECEELKTAQSKLKCKEVELVADLENIRKHADESTKRQHHWEEQIRTLVQAETQDHQEYSFVDDDEDEDSDDSKEATDDVSVEGEGAEGENKATRSKRKRNGLPTLSSSSLSQYDRDETKYAIKVLEQERDTIAKNANMGAIAEYRRKEKDYLSRIEELDDVTEQRNESRRQHEDLRRKRLEMFLDGFGTITLKLKEMYQMITLGGDAELELVDSLDPFSEGIVFSVRPPKKSWKNIANLSGGEKTLSSLALVFALHHYKPTPLYVMDEIDAALDFRNVSIVAHYIKQRTRNAQFVIISLRNNMFELADRLVGIYKTFNCTKSITINPHAFGLHGQERRSSKGLKKGTPQPLRDSTNNDSSAAVGGLKTSNRVATVEPNAMSTEKA